MEEHINNAIEEEYIRDKELEILGTFCEADLPNRSRRKFKPYLSLEKVIDMLENKKYKSSGHYKFLVSLYEQYTGEEIILRNNKPM